MEDILRQILPHLPPNLQAIILDPPSLSRPATFWPVIQAILPYTKWIVVLVAFYIVYTVIAGVFGYFTRFVRFAFRFAPILALIAWVMSNSGQGGMDELFEVVKSSLGLGNAAQGRARSSPGIASLADLFSGSSTSSNSNRKRKSSFSSPFSSSSGPSTRSKTKRAGSRSKSNESPDGDVLSSILESAAGVVNRGDDWQEAVQGFVKQSLAKAAGLDWLLGTNKAEEEEGTSRTRRR